MANISDPLDINMLQGGASAAAADSVGQEFVPNLNTENKGYAWTVIENYPKPLHPGVYNTLNADEIMAKFKTVQSIWQ